MLAQEMGTMCKCSTRIISYLLAWDGIAMEHAAAFSSEDTERMRAKAHGTTISCIKSITLR